MKVWGLGAALLLSVMVAGCGGNSTTAGVTVSPTTAPVLLGDTQQFSDIVTGISTTTVSWQICLPSNSSDPTVAPTVCTVPQGPPSGCTLPKVKTLLVGYGAITLNGLYTAPLQMPATNIFDVVATSCATTDFGIGQVILDSGINVTVLPPTATLPASGAAFQFTANVTGTNNTAVNWTLSNPSLPPPPATNLGSITPAGLYTPPPTANVSTVIITATSAADVTKSGTAMVTIAAAADPAISTITPTTAEEGSAQQDVYLTGANFFTGSTVTVGGVTEPTSAVTWISGTLMRVTIPASQLAVPGPLQIVVNNGTGNSSPATLTVNPTRPALIASSLDSVPQSAAGGAGITLTGGFFVNSGSTATFNGAGCGMGVCTSFLDSRDLHVTIPSGQLGVPGLYPIVVQNSDAAAASKPSKAALNLAVTPAAFSGTSTGNVTVGTNPSAIAIDYADDEAVVANKGDGTVSIINLATDTVVPPAIGVGHMPTGVAVDDLLPHPVALVVNSADQSVTAIDLSTKNEATISVSISSGANPPLPYSVGINPITPQPTPQLNGTAAPVTHRAIVAYQSTNVATILEVSVDLTVAGGTPVFSPAGHPLVQQVGAGSTSYSTGQNPAIAIDPRLNWALVTPGGAGTINVVDLGRDAYPAGGDSGRAPQVVATLSITPSVQGVAINSETHQAFLTDPNAGLIGDTNGSFSSFSMLDQTVNTLQFQNGPTVNSFVAAAVDPLTNIGVAVNSAINAAEIADLEKGVVLQNVTLTGVSGAVAVAVDPMSNQALAVSTGTPGSVSFFSLGSSGVNPLQILEASPAITYTSPTNLTLTITGGGFASGTSQVLLDGTAIPTTFFSARKLQATVPSSMLKSARNYFVQVQNTVGAVVTVSNVADLTVVQPLSVGTSPVGVAVDASRDIAVVTNFADGTVTLVSLAPGAASSLGTFAVGTGPIGVATIPRLGLALVGNSESANLSVVDVTVPTTAIQATSGCNGSPCTGQLGVAINQDSALAAIANSSSNNVTFAQIATGPLAVNPTDTFTVDLFPTSVAMDPVVSGQPAGTGLAAIATASLSSSIEFMTTPSPTNGGPRISGLQLPTDIIFDPLNQVFLAVDSLENDVVAIDPVTFNSTFMLVGVNPTSLDYNFQTSTLVTVNSLSHTMSVLEYVCPPPPNGNPATCPAAQARAILGLGSQSPAGVSIAPQAIAVDPGLNLAVLVDPSNNKILVVPLLH